MDKNSINELAILDGRPLFESTLHVGYPNQGDRKKIITNINAVLDANWLTNSGPFVNEFEQRVAAYLGVKHCVAMCNGTIALEIASRALGLSGEVIVPSFTFAATAHSLQWQEIKPVFCDVDPDSHHIDTEKIEQLITPRTTAILAVHLWGRPCQVEQLEAIAERNNLKLLFDASHAFGSTYKGRYVGGFGNAETFSFHATKFINTFEGGAVTTNDDDLAQKMRLMKNFGFSGMDNVIHLGINGKMNEVCAAMGLVSLDSIDKFIESNRSNYLMYKKVLSGLPGCRMLEYDQAEENNYQYVVLEIDPGFGLSRDFLLKILHAENVRARRYFYPGCHRMEPYRTRYPEAGGALLETERLADRVLCLPTGVNITTDDIDAIAGLILFTHRHAEEIRAAFVQ